MASVVVDTVAVKPPESSLHPIADDAVSATPHTDTIIGLSGGLYDHIGHNESLNLLLPVDDIAARSGGHPKKRAVNPVQLLSMVGLEYVVE